MRRNSSIAAASAAAAVLALAAAAPAGAIVGTGKRGPTTTVNPYVLPVAHGVETTSLLTVTDQPAGNGYKMVGIPDGLGARDSAGKLELFMTHELGTNMDGTPRGAVRAHGQKGAFVSNYKINKATFAVETGKDLIDSPSDVTYYNYLTGAFAAAPNAAGIQADGDVFPAYTSFFQRFCSATLSDPGALYNATTGRGYSGQIFFGNEESGNEGRVFGILADDGTTKQLPRLGLFSWENTVPAPNASDTTLVMGQEDAATGQLWAYAGTKTSSGDAFERAGLNNGTDFVVDLVNEAVSTDAGFRGAYPVGTPAPFDLAEVDWDQSGADQNIEAAGDGLTLNRIEDGHWDPDNPNDFYFLTTEGGNTTPAPSTTNSRDGGGLWRLRYTNIEQPALGGTLTLLLNGTETPYLNKPDNMTIDTHGNILIQEDPGNNASLARIVAYEIGTGRRGVIAQFDAVQFAPVTPGGTDAPFTADEESSGIIDAKDILGDGEFLLDAQVHKTIVEASSELVEHGQLLHLDVDDWDAVYTGWPSVADNPVGFWRFGEEAGPALLDSSGYDNDGTYLGMPTLGVPGALVGEADTAVSFDGVNDTGRVPDSASMHVGTSFSLEGWIKRSSTTKSHQMMVKGNAYQLVVMNAGSGGQVWLRKANVTTLARSSGGIPADGAYHHVVATIDGPGSTAKIYIDGVADTVIVSSPQSIPDTTFPLSFGIANSTEAKFDEFALYDQVLTPAQVTAHRTAGIT